MKAEHQIAPGRLDRLQRRFIPAAFVYAVIQKFFDDRAGNLAALIAYFAFFSVFPLLLALTTILGFVLAGNPELQETVYTSAVGDLPIIGQHSAINPIKGNWFALIVGLVLAIWSGIQVARNAQTAFNIVYSVPRIGDPGFIPRIVRSLELVTVGGLGLIVTTFLQGVVSGDDNHGWHLGAFGIALSTVLGVVGNFILFTYLFRRLTIHSVSFRESAPGAALAAIVWAVLQRVGTGLVDDKIRGAEGTYGTFALVIGLISWFYILAMVTMICAEVNVVLSQRLWPRSLGAINRRGATRADMRAYRIYPRRENQAHNMVVEAYLTWLPHKKRAPDGGSAPGGVADGAVGGAAGGAVGASRAAEELGSAVPDDVDSMEAADPGPPTQPLRGLPIRRLRRED